MATKHLPKQFQALEPLVPLWALDTENKRSARRWASDAADFQALYDAMINRIEEVMEYLDQYSVEDMPDDARALYHLALAFAEASPHVEMYKGSPEVPYSFDARRFVAAHGDVVDGA